MYQGGVLGHCRPFHPIQEVLRKVCYTRKEDESPLWNEVRCYADFVSRLLTLCRSSKLASETAFVYLLKRLVELCRVPRLKGSERDMMLG